MRNFCIVKKLDYVSKEWYERKDISDFILFIGRSVQHHKPFCFYIRRLLTIFMLCKECEKKKNKIFPYLIGSKRNFGIAESQTKKQ